MDSSSSSIPAALNALIEQEFKTAEWRAVRSRLRTYSVVFLPPHKFTNTEKDAKTWVEGVFGDLFRRYENLNGGTAMDQAQQPGHFTIVMNTEFGFNGAWTGNRWEFSAKYAISVDAETAIRVAVQEQLAHYRDTHNILFVLSCCTQYTPNNPGEPGISVVGRNRLTILSTKSDDAIILPKKAKSDRDGWIATTRVETVDNDETPMKSGPPLRVRRSPAQPSSITFPNLAGRNYAIRVGLGTCLDSKNETYPDVNVIAFLGGETGESTIMDRHIGHAFNDSLYWTDPKATSDRVKLQMTVINEVSKMSEPGVRYWDPTTIPGLIQVLPIVMGNGPIYGPGHTTRLSGDFINFGLSPAVPLPDSRLYMSDGKIATSSQENEFYGLLQTREKERFRNIIRAEMSAGTPWTVSKVTAAYSSAQIKSSGGTAATKCVFGEYLVEKENAKGCRLS